MDGREEGLRVLNAGNAGPFTLDGTRTYLVGEREVAVMDPGPDLDNHVRALLLALDGAQTVRVLVTHRHRDHAGAAGALARALDAPVLGPAEAEGAMGPGVTFRVLRDREEVPTDAGPLTAVATPGHTRGHLAFLWGKRRALFAGDLLLGEGDTTWVGEYPGCVADYLTSLDRVEGLGSAVIYPGHGPPLTDPDATIARFRRHRLDRARQVRELLAADPGASPDTLLLRVYGAELPHAVREAALRSLEALREYVLAAELEHGG
ncbi:MAG: MBL fold metallo-hydrolase [Gemmatimonadota bacterium]